MCQAAPIVDVVRAQRQSSASTHPWASPIADVMSHSAEPPQHADAVVANTPPGVRYPVAPRQCKAKEHI